MQYQLDLRAYTCPLPLLMAQKALKSLQRGDSLTLILNRESSLNDFEPLCQTMNLTLVHKQENEQEVNLNIAL